MLNIYNLSSPPRNVPLLVKSNLLFGGMLNQLGWFFFGFGLIFAWVFALNADVLSWYYFSLKTESVSGQVSSSQRTSFSVGGGKHSDGTPVYANHYTYQTDGHVTYKGISYATGKQLQAGTDVQVEYVKAHPNISRIKGMRMSAFGPWVLFVLIFPAIGFIFIVIGVKSGLKAIRLLRYGKVGLGTLKSKLPTNTRINNQIVYKLAFEFTAGNGSKYEAVAKTHKPEVLEDNAQEQLLYEETNPAYAVMLDSLPGGPRIDEQGLIQVRSYLSGLPVMIVPFLTIVGHGIYLFIRLGTL
ncbi:MAG: DUF3592 domain-containing protein [Candidatus Brocadiia bacterium]